MRYPHVFSLCLILATAGSPSFAETTKEALSLPDATRRVLERHPEIQVATALEEAAAGRTQQAGVISNPEIGYLVEDFSGDTGRSIGAGTTTMSLSQRLSLPGKRGSRINVAEAEQKEAAQSRQARKLALIRLTRESYSEVLAASERQRMAEDSLQLARQLREAVSARVEAGKVSPIELSRAGVAMAAAEREARLAAQQHQVAMRSLASLWNGSERAIELVTPLDMPSTLPAAPAVFNQNPLLQQLQTRIDRQRAALSLARANTLPDFTVSVGLKEEAVIQEQSLQLGISIPLPVFDRNQGERRAANAELSAAEAMLAAERATLGREVDRLASEREGAYYEALQLRDGVLKTATQALEGTREGYRAGKFSLIDLLDAQRALVEARRAYLVARLTFQKTDAALDELAGTDTFSEVNP